MKLQSTILLAILAIQNGVLAAPAVGGREREGEGIPFVSYGPPSSGSSSFDVELLPPSDSSEEQPSSVIPGTKNLGERTQLPSISPVPRYFRDNLPSSSNNEGNERYPSKPYDEKSVSPNELIPVSEGIRPLLGNSDEELKNTPTVPSFRPNPPKEIVVTGSSDNSQELVLPNDKPSTLPSPDSSADSPIVVPPGTSVNTQDKRGQYSHGFASPDGTEIQETGRLITTNGGWEYVIAKEGSYSYKSPEGVPITVRYIADHNGYRILGQSFGRR